MLFVWKPPNYDGEKREFNVMYLCELLTFDQVCKTRNDDWSKDVFGRIQFMSDLHAANAVYYQHCSVNFQTNEKTLDNTV